MVECTQCSAYAKYTYLQSYRFIEGRPERHHPAMDRMFATKSQITLAPYG